MFQTKVVENINTHILCSVTIFPEYRVVYEAVWKNMSEPYSPQMAICCMRIACWIPKATNTHSQYAILIAVPPQQWLHERASMFTLHVQCLSCLYCKCVFMDLHRCVGRRRSLFRICAHADSSFENRILASSCLPSSS